MPTPDSVLQEWWAALEESGGPKGDVVIDLDPALVREGVFPIERALALKIAKREYALGPPGEVAPVHRPALARLSFVPALEGEGTEVVFGNDEFEEVLGLAPQPEPGGIAPIGRYESWWLVLAGDAAGTIWGQWEDLWVPFYVVDAGEVKLGTIRQWLELVNR